MDLYRVGDKLVSKEKLLRSIDRILALRSSGLSQQEAASRVGVDRSFISRLEALAEIRRGAKIAVIGFPISNYEELQAELEELGVDYVWILSERQRWDYIQSLSGHQLLNELMELMTKLQDFDAVIMIGSDMRIRLAEAILGDKVIGMELGISPIESDIYVEPADVGKMVRTVRGSKG